MVNTPLDSREGTRHSEERGAVMFVVLMVILILSAIGTFALSNARYELQTSGFSRQRTLSQQMADFGSAAAANEVASAPAAYTQMMKNASAAASPERCASQAGLSLVSPPPPCYHLYLQDIENRTGMSTDHIVRPPNIASNTPGSFGLTKMSGGFWVELTDPMEVTRPVPGAPIDGSPGTPKFLDVTLSSTGVVFPDDNMNAIVDWSLGEGRGALFTSGRGHVIVGPIYASL
jgi:hypothetical protein